jgi:tetratricopeptide (TPR) repeat protein
MTPGKQNNIYQHPDVMISSTYTDLILHRKAVSEALLRLGFFPIGMEYDSSKAGKDIIASSMEMATKAQAYVGIVSHRYGGVPKDAARNPQKLSITELEYREALKRGIPVYMFLMSEKHPVSVNDVETVSGYKKKLKALRADAQSRSICAEFSSVEELKTLLLQSMAEFKAELAQASPETISAQAQAQRQRERELPVPPELLAVPDFISGHEFVGRQTELGWLDEWASSPESLMIIEAIGGAGKSTLAWQWLKERVAAVRPDIAGVMWYSFYEGGADMSLFAAYALAYITGEPLKEFYGRKTSDLARLLIKALHERPFLLVLDGLERVLVAYHRMDASQARDDQVASEKSDRACIKPSDDELLRQLIAAAPSKILITSRLMPIALTNKAGQPLPGVRHRFLGGLQTEDALTMMQENGVRGNESAIKRYLKENFDNHPLLVGIIAGLVHNYIREPDNFDRWADDPQGGAALDFSKLDLSQRRTHILATALTGLEPDTRQLLSRIAALGGAVSFDTVAALNPFLPPSPNFDEEELGYVRDNLTYLQDLLKNASGESLRASLTHQIEEVRGRLDRLEVKHATYLLTMKEYSRSEDVRQATPKLISALQDLEWRGLLQWDRQKNIYDLHPVVRGYAFDVLEETERTDICNLIVDHFQSKPSDKYEEARTLADVQQSISIFRALVQSKRFEEAAEFFSIQFSITLMFSVEAYHEILSLLKPLFPNGFQKPPTRIVDNFYQSELLNLASLSFWGGHQLFEAQGSQVAALRINLDRLDVIPICGRLTNLGAIYMAEKSIARSFVAIDLSLELSETRKDKEDIAKAHLDLMRNYRIVGLFNRAQVAYAAFRRTPPPRNRAIYRHGTIECELCWLRFYEGKLTDELLDEAEAIALDGNNRVSVRSLWLLRGEFALRQSDTVTAIFAFERAIEMAQIVGVPIKELEARFALAKATAGELGQARETCDRLHELDQPPHVGLASAYLEIKDFEKAREHALKGYKESWADGPPYALWWELNQCRAVLKALNEPEPKLPPFDPKLVEPLPFEDEIRQLITSMKMKVRRKTRSS